MLLENGSSALERVGTQTVVALRCSQADPAAEDPRGLGGTHQVLPVAQVLRLLLAARGHRLLPRAHREALP